MLVNDDDGEDFSIPLPTPIRFGALSLSIDDGYLSMRATKMGLVFREKIKNGSETEIQKEKY